MPSEALEHWLNRHGLSVYLHLFHDNKIDLDVLSNLTEADFRELGIALGDRKRILSAIATLNAREAGAPANTAIHVAEGERRQLTVLFCDMVGFTELANRVDPEVLQDIVRIYEDTCAVCVSRYEGYVFQRLGDGVVAFFGYPLAHEGEAERALHAALAMVEAFTKLDVQQVGRLRVRIGVATGLVVVASVEKGAVGETMNLASRLQGVAPEGGIVISEQVRRLAGGAFEYEPLGELVLKGIAQPVSAWRVLGRSGAVSRFDASTLPHQLTTFIGREEEVSLLKRRWALALDGEGQVLLLSGEPGIGKSRISRVLSEHAATASHVILRAQCSPYHLNAALHPFTGMLTEAAGFNRDDDIEAECRKLDGLMARAKLDRDRSGPLLSALLSMDTGDRYPPIKVTPQRQMEETLKLLASLIAGLSLERPVLLLFEDAHWIDPTSLDALDTLIAQVHGYRVVLLVSFRPEFTPRWGGRSHVTSLSLNRLSRRQAAAMVAGTTRGKALPEAVLDQIVAKTDGVPLFVEELTKAVLESGRLAERDDRYELIGSLVDLAIPATLRDSLVARLDRIAGVKEVAQLGACIGREFSHEMLAAVSTLNEAELRHALDQLVASDLVQRHGFGVDASYVFKHALVQDAAYESLLKSRRLVLHQIIGEALEQRFPERAAREPETLAQHFALAGMAKKSTSYWLSAASQAANRFANAEAIAYGQRGLEVLSALPQGQEHDHLELLLQATIGWPYAITKGYGAPDVLRTFARARELSNTYSESAHIASVNSGLFNYYVMRAEYNLSAEIVRQTERLAAQDPTNAAIHLLSLGIAGTQALICGRYSSAAQLFKEGYAFYTNQPRRDFWRDMGAEFGPYCADWMSWAVWISGRPDEAEKWLETADRMVHESSHPFSMAMIFAHAAIFAYFNDDPARTMSAANRTIALCDETGIPLRGVEAKMLLGWAQSELGDPVAGTALLESALDEWIRMGTTIANSAWYALLALSHARASKLDAAHCAIENALDFVNRTGERFWEAEVYRIRGRLHTEDATPDRAAAEKDFLKAMDVARSQGARMIELRAATCLAQLWRSQGKETEGVSLLRPIYDKFTEGFDTKDLKRAEAVIRI